MFKRAINEIKSRLNVVGLSDKDMRKRANEELTDFIKSLDVEELSQGELEFYSGNLDINEQTKLTILQNFIMVRGFKFTMFHMLTSVDICVLIVSVAKYLIAHDNIAISEVLLSNRTTSIVDYNVEDVFEIVKRNYMEGLSTPTSEAMEELMSIIKSTVIITCFNSRELVSYDNEANESEIILQPRDIVAGLVSIFLEGDK